MKEELKEAYEAGIDYAKNGANENNCNFSLFSSKEKTKAWEQGVDDFRGTVKV